MSGVDDDDSEAEGVFGMGKPLDDSDPLGFLSFASWSWPSSKTYSWGDSEKLSSNAGGEGSGFSSNWLNQGCARI